MALGALLVGLEISKGFLRGRHISGGSGLRRSAPIISLELDRTFACAGRGCAGRVRRTGDAMRGRKPGSALPWTIGITAAVYGILGLALSSRPPAHISPFVARALGMVPFLIAVINASALGCLLAGWLAIRAGRVQAHRTFMLASATLIFLFLLLYVTRVSLGGVKAFQGPPEVRRFVYLPILSVHIALSILSVPPVVYNLLIGLTNDAGDSRVPAAQCRVLTGTVCWSWVG